MNADIPLNNDTQIPLLGFGTWQITGQDAYDATVTAIKAGYRHIDTAMIYKNEEEVGRAIADSGIPREELFVTTKLWNTDHGDVQAAFDLSLNKLGLDYVDLYLMHWPVPTRVEAYKQMEIIAESGHAKAIGVSNFTIRHLESFLPQISIKPAINQVEFHPFLNQKELHEYCKSNDIVLEAYSPLAHAKNLDSEKLKVMAVKYSKSPAQIMLRWATQQGIIVIPKSTNKNRITENLESLAFDITGDDMAEMSSWDENLRTCGDPTDMP
jgi:diketogulonate reductase-like aldo/keto reductase